jgi:sec-independent protein translocase protein TatC
MTSRDEDLSTKCTKPFVEHLEDLRDVVLRIGLWLVAGMLVAIPLAPYVVEFLKIPLAKAGANPDDFLKVLTVSGGFNIAMKVIFWTGLLLSFPFIVFQIGRFVFPGLTRRERRAVLYASGAAGFLFVAGVAMGYVFAVPVALKCLFQINEWMGISCAFVELGSYIAFVLQLLVCFGAAFELPVIVFALGALGLVSHGWLRDKRRHAIVLLLFLAMVLTPSTDVITMLIMAVPMIVLYEICIWAVWFVEKRGSRIGASG